MAPLLCGERLDQDSEARPAIEHLERLKTALAARYRVERELGAGGMATVYLAEDLKHHRRVAIKVLRPELAVVQWARDLGRSIDYLETRKDVDASRLGYFGYSWGGRIGGLMLAVEPRIKAAVLNVAGLKFQRALPEADPLHLVR